MTRTGLGPCTALPAMAALAVCGCATVMHGTMQEVSILSAPAGAQVSVDSAAVGRTPLSIQLRRKAAHQVRIEAAGYESYDASVGRHVSGWVWGNLLLTVYAVIGVPVDLLTGGLYSLEPDWIRASLTPSSNMLGSRDSSTDAKAAAGARSISRLERAVMVGSRVRATGSGGSSAVDGIVTAVRADTLELRTVRGQVPLVLPLDHVERLELGVGRKGHAGRGALIGAVAGGVLGWVVTAATYRPCTGWCLFGSYSRDEEATIGAVFVGVAGAEMGLLIGGKILTEVWQPVPLDAIRLGVAPLPSGRLGLGASLAF